MARNSLKLNTFLKVKQFLEKQEKPIKKRNLSTKLGVDWYSLQIALNHLDIEESKEGIKLKT